MGRIYQQTRVVRDEHGNSVLGPDGKPKRVPSSKYWWISYYDTNGKRHYESTGETTKAKARKVLTAREAARDKGEPVGNRVGKITFDEAETDIINDYRVNGRRSLDDAQRRIDKHLKPVFGGRRMASITTADARAYAAARLDAGAKAAGVNRELAVLKRMFTLAVQAGKLLYRPHIPMLRERNVRTGFFEREQFEAVRANLPTYLQPLVTFAYLTGWRIISEVMPLRVGQIDLNAGIVRLEAGTTKNDEARTFHFAALGELREVLTDQIAAAERLSRDNERIISFVFHESSGAEVNEYRFRLAWKAACEAAGCPGKIPHDFRRTAVRNLVRAGVPERVAMMMTGHKTRSVFERYNITSGADLADAARKLDAFLTAKPVPETGQKSPAQVRQFKRRSPR
jgi:integrase